MLSGLLLSPGNHHGLEVLAPFCVIRGIRVTRFPGHGIVLRSSECGITGCAVVNNDLNGILVEGEENKIGSALVADSNVVSGNGGNGVALSGAGATFNRIRRNFIGVWLWTV